ncbi:MAG: SusC/RagA family TonB-linked outer membrane protein [Candidatus Pseudobacter hemicellulosilyticus]|uniref:SusC/RagA family TonB-linked outer membrane protein n=1 Tax=Candidatus Pseudobacter hemicellulosilyticus TaxID=3121375 RepID=A0AAJ6BFR5_9BACT|nr:MAG: SusC/RagA family TonB-linked outer membrane protein [Pseudobacter sp.]
MKHLFNLRSLVCLLTVVFTTLSAVAQTPLQVRGTVLAENGEALEGVTVNYAERGSRRNQLSTTNSKGVFTTGTLKAGATYDFIFSYVGFGAETIKGFVVKEGEDNTLLVRMKSSDKNIDEVVVTALGIKRDQKALGFATTTLGGEDVTDAISNNWSDALKGKVAGLNLLQTGSGPLNSTRINLRGDRAMSLDDNDALIIVDGVPMINSRGRGGSGTAEAYGAGVSGDKDIPIDFGNGLSDINPDDIESITVLKGAAATALYGSRAGNGALIITTKSGKRKGGGIGVTVNSNSSISDVLRWPDWQYEYGQGNNNRNANGDLYYSYNLSADGANTGSTSSAFGPKFNGQEYFQYDPVTETQGATRTPWVPYKNNIKDFWRTGSNFTNSVALDGGNENFSARASITHTKNEWIMPNTGFERLVAAFNSSMKLSEKLKVNAKITYTNKTSDNLPGTGYNNQSIAYFMIFQNPNVDLGWYEPRWKKGQEQIAQIHPFSSYIENPYLIAYEMTNSLNNNNIDGSLQATYTFNDKFDLMLRSGIATRQDQRAQRRPWNTANFPQGYYKEQDVFFMEYNNDFLFSYHDKLSKDFQIRASVGGNQRYNRYKASNAVVRGLLLPGVYKLSNAMDRALAEGNRLEESKINSLYALANLSWKEKVFVDITGRHDYASTLPQLNNNYFFPSVSTSTILSDLFRLPSVISFAKLRLSWAKVGMDTDPYRTSKAYGISNFPGSADAPTTLHNNDLKPRMVESWETGLNVFLFRKRINLDISLYTNNTVNEVIQVPLDITTGFSSKFINAGKVRNRGIELMLSGNPVETKNFTWTATATWTKNENRILRLSDDLEGSEQPIASSGNASIIATVGGSTGDIWGFGLVRNEEGKVVFDAATGMALRPADITKIGNAYADWRAGLVNEFRYKQFRFVATLDGQYGGMIYSQSFHKMTEQGKLKHTLYGRETGTVIGDGVVKTADGKYETNTKAVAVNSWYGDYYRRANVETNSFDASYIKLRELRLEYSLPASFVKKIKMTGVSVALYGRDLAMISDFPIFDPETASLNGSSIVPGVEMGQMPTPRTMGVNITLKL